MAPPPPRPPPRPGGGPAHPHHLHHPAADALSEEDALLIEEGLVSYRPAFPGALR